MYFYDDDKYATDGPIVSKTGEEGDIVLLEASIGTDVPSVIKASRQFLVENKNQQGQPFVAAKVGILFQTVWVENPNVKHEGETAPKKPNNLDGMGGK